MKGLVEFINENTGKYDNLYRDITDIIGISEIKKGNIVLANDIVDEFKNCLESYECKKLPKEFVNMLKSLEKGGYKFYEIDPNSDTITDQIWEVIEVIEDSTCVVDDEYSVSYQQGNNMIAIYGGAYQGEDGLLYIGTDKF